MRKSTSLLLALGVLFCASMGAFAQPGGKGPKGGFGGQFQFGKKKGGGDNEPGIPSASAGPLKITRWEYRIQTGPADVETLNNLGSAGWELTGVEPADKGRPSRYIFRRPLAGNPKIDAATDPAPKEKADVKLELRTYVMKHASAVEIAGILSDVLRVSKTDPLRIVAEPRTNQLIVNGSMPMHAEIMALVEKLDAPEASPGAGKKAFKGFGGK